MQKLTTFNNSSGQAIDFFFSFCEGVSHIFVIQADVGDFYPRWAADDSLTFQGGTPTPLGIIDSDSTHAAMGTDGSPA